MISERTVTGMGFGKGFAGLAGLAGMACLAAGLAGCGGTAPGQPPGTPAPQTPVVRTTASSVPAASPRVKARARTAAAQFYDLYSASRFTAFWDLLAPATKRLVPRSIWVAVHEACPAGGRHRVIKAVTVFGNAAIVTETIPGAAVAARTAQDVFNYANGRWSYSPGDLSIYRHRSVTSDVAAARAAGLCAGWKIF